MLEIKYNKPIHIQNMTLLKVTPFTYDLFYGHGWHNRRRIAVNKSFVRVLEGKNISYEHKKLIQEVLK